MKFVLKLNGALNTKSTDPFVKLNADGILTFLRNVTTPGAPLALRVTLAPLTVSVGITAPAGSVTVRAFEPEINNVALSNPPTAPSKVEAIDTSPNASRVPTAELFPF